MGMKEIERRKKKKKRSIIFSLSLVKIKMYPMKKRYLNIRGRNIYQCEPCRFSNEKKKEKIEGYGVSFQSEKIDKKEKEPMTKLQEKLSKIELK